jgi:hypothetical protein
MPWRARAALTRDDAQAIVAYLRSLKAVKNYVAGPFGPGQKVTGFVMLIPADKYAPNAASAGPAGPAGRTEEIAAARVR